MRLSRIRLFPLVVLVCAICIFGATAQQPELPPGELVRQAVKNEMSASTVADRHFMFKDEKKTRHLSQTKLIVETRDAVAGMIILQNGQPLNPEQQQAETARLENYIHNPDELKKKRKQESEDAERTERIVKALPDALVYEPAGTQEGTASVGRPGDRLVRLKFKPNPDYNPPSHVEQVLTGMAGTLLVDSTEKRIAEIEGTLQQDVGFGWGILGHLDRGGRFVVQQADVGGKHWEVTRMELSFTGKVLFFKKLDIRSSDIFSEFRPVPKELSFAQGVDLLKEEAAKATRSAR
jgi:hypothetical protein